MKLKLTYITNLKDSFATYCSAERRSTLPVTLLNSPWSDLPCFWCTVSFTVASALSFAAGPVPQLWSVPLMPFIWPSPSLSKLNLSPSCSPCFATSDARISSICFRFLICCSRATCSRSICAPPATVDLRAVFLPAEAGPFSAWRIHVEHRTHTHAHFMTWTWFVKSHQPCFGCSLAANGHW